jgi:hypothetical protein
MCNRLWILEIPEQIALYLSETTATSILKFNITGSSHLHQHAQQTTTIEIKDKKFI